MQRLTGSWAKADPADFNFVTAVNGGESWSRMVNEAFREAGLPPEDNIVQAIAVNGAPFLDILNKQTKLEVFGFVTRNNLQKRIAQIIEGIDSTGIGPSVELKRALVADYPQGDLCPPDSTTGQASFWPTAAELQATGGRGRGHCQP